MTQTPSKQRRAVWLSRITLLLGFASVGIALVGALGAGADLWPKMAGMAGLKYAFYVGAAALLVGIITLVFHFKAGGRVVLIVLLGLVLGGGYVGYIGTQIAKAKSLPMIHDISTDLDNPPEFAKLSLRADNLDNMPGADDPAMRGMDAEQRLHAMQRKAYGNIDTVYVAATPAEVMAKAEQLMKARGWDIAIADPATGRIEATDTVALLKFKDDVVLRAAPQQGSNGGGMTAVDMRSVSRLGLSDLGVNARRVRTFMADLKDEFPPQ